MFHLTLASFINNMQSFFSKKKKKSILAFLGTNIDYGLILGTMVYFNNFFSIFQLSPYINITLK